jgi:hypothetical protein
MMGRPNHTPDTFWAQFDRSGGPDSCWPWRGVPLSAGYQKTSYQGHCDRVHRIAYYVANGRWPSHNVCHTCDNRPCGNPAHLVDASYAWNMADMVAKGRHRPGAPKYALTPQQVDQVVAAIAAGTPDKHIAAAVGCSQRTVFGIRTGRSPWYVGGD